MWPLPYHHTLGNKVPQEYKFFILFSRLALPYPYTITVTCTGFAYQPTPLIFYPDPLLFPPPPTSPPSAQIPHLALPLIPVFSNHRTISLLWLVVIALFINKITYYTRKRINGWTVWTPNNSPKLEGQLISIASLTSEPSTADIIAFKYYIRRICLYINKTKCYSHHGNHSF